MSLCLIDEMHQEAIQHVRPVKSVTLYNMNNAAILACLERANACGQLLAHDGLLGKLVCNRLAGLIQASIYGRIGRPVL